MSVASQSAFPSVLISVDGRGKNQLELGQESKGDAVLLPDCSLIRNP
jgi:hypothetical protein